MNIERLQILSHFLRELPLVKFEFGRWCGHTSRCGTVACALGWACMIPEFQNAGLILDDGIPTFKGKTYSDAGAKFFGLTEKQGDALFTYEGFRVFQLKGWPVTATMVADKIDKLIAAHLKRHEVKRATQFEG